jgi:hypothetical protein
MQGERNQRLLQIQQLERQLAELTAAVQALRNDGRLPNDAPHGPNRRTGDDFGDDIAGVRARELAETAGRNLRVFVMDLKQPETEHRIRVHAPAQFRLRLHDDVKLARVDIDKPEVIKLAEQSPHEVVLVTVHPGVAIVKLWDNQEHAYTLHADVAQAGRAEIAADADGRRAVTIAKNYTAVRQLENAPGRGELVETLTRVKYKLPQAKAQALAAFLQEHVGGDVETKVDGETLTVTAVPDHQARIGQFIQLLEPSPRRPEQPGERRQSSNDRYAPLTPSVAPTRAIREAAPAVLGPSSSSLPPASPPVSRPPTPAATPGVDAGILPAVPPPPATVPAAPGTARP